MSGPRGPAGGGRVVGSGHQGPAGVLPPALAPLRERPGEAALFLDYDGTLAPIVDDPAGAAPFPGVPELLVRLAARLALVAVVSGRPVAYLVETLGSGPAGGPAGVHLAGLYGMEELTADGRLRSTPEAEQWRIAVSEVTRLAAASAPPGAEVEPKGLTVTFHWRRRPDAEGWASELAHREGARTGLVAQPGRMAVELRPPVAADKGTVLRRLAPGHRVVACFGDDLGDLPAFRALDELAAAGVVEHGVRVAVAGDGSPPEVVAEADVVVAGPQEAVGMLRRIAGQ